MHEEPSREERGQRKEARVWTYYAGPGEEYTGSAAEAASGKGSRQAGHVYTNDDVTRQNDKNGTVKFKGQDREDLKSPAPAFQRCLLEDAAIRAGTPVKRTWNPK